VKFLKTFGCRILDECQLVKKMIENIFTNSL